jgi:hypothetical protein
MLKCEKSKQGSVETFKLSGIVNETFSLDPPETQELHVFCGGITRINSVGVKGWIQYFTGVSQMGVKLIFKECSPLIVEQLNMISNFSCGGTVESIQVPFTCQKCVCGAGGMSLVAKFSCDALKKANFQIGAAKCPKGDSQAVFDDFPEEYFAFLMRNK